MNEEALDALELGPVLERLAEATATPLGAGRALALRPSVRREEVERRRSLTDEAVALLDHAAEPPLQGIHDIRPAAERAAHGGSLTPAALAEVAATVEASLRARQALAETELAPGLRRLADAIEPGLSQLAEEIRRRVEDDGSDLRDGASPRLRSLRRELRAGRQRVQEALERLTRSAALRPHLQETFIVQRSGRPVLAVKASSRGSVPGLVHDASESRQTLFVEPFEVVELNNRQSEAAAEEREEAERLLRELSLLVAARAGALAALADAVAAVDLAVASGAVSRAWRGTRVAIGDRVRLLGARHPLLDPATAVPIDLDLGLLRAVVISGPNTGGKTVALKTLGLAAVLHQCGLRPPAVEAELPVFDAVLVEIGDQQSIAMSLSTFAAHVRNLVAVLDDATEASLVLVDELASGTDPVEGAALAQALLQRLARQVRLVVVTTHFAELKAWASAADDAANAATAVDPQTHEPLYRVTLGRAGTSHALETAARLGLEPEVVAAARAAISPEAQRTGDLLAEAEAAERTAAAELAAARAERDAAQAAAAAARVREHELAAEIERVRASAAAERERAIAQAQADLAAVRAELGALRQAARDARRRHREVERAAAAGGDAERQRDRELGAASEHASRAERALRSLERPVAPAGPLGVGDPVESPEVGLRGTIVAIDGGEAEVAGSSGQRVRIALARLRPHAGADLEAERPAVRVRATVPVDPRHEVDVRGRTAQEAREAARALVEDAAVAGLSEVRVVHGRGTGALRTAVRDELRRHPLVHEIRGEAADGATVADLGG